MCIQLSFTIVKREVKYQMSKHLTVLIDFVNLYVITLCADYATLLILVYVIQCNRATFIICNLLAFSGIPNYAARYIIYTQ